MRKANRSVAAFLPLALVASMMTAVLLPAVASAGPSVDLPTVPSTSVSQQQMNGAVPPDEAAGNELHGDQPARGAGLDGGGVSTASPLSPSASWTVSPQAGNFTWSYPLRVPPVPGGFAPTLGLSYDSSSVDGRTSATNNQASWIGDGWDLSVGFIERSYLPCANDTMGDTTPPKTEGDLCWRSDNAVASYGGAGGELIRDDATGEWRSRNDDGSRIQRFEGASGVANGDANGEYWKITTTDGTQYLFGSRPEAASTWTVPVFGDDSGEPCHAATFDASHCVQAWRWNLDKIIDPRGNVINFSYGAETNSYGMGGKDAAVSYQRGGTLNAIDYGLRDDDASQPAVARVQFSTADRCVPGSDCTPSKKDNWPDVNWDDKCDTPTCPNKHSPTFWSTKRLDKITTKVRNGSGYSDVESWTLNQQFPVNGDGEKPALWLKSIQHTGLAGGTPVSLPAVSFEGNKFPNRVDKVDGVGPLLRYRITAVISETGGVTTVTYAPPDCVSGVSMPANPQTNSLRCFPMKWAKKDFSERTDYFHKYVVAKVTLSDRISANTEEVSSYEYLDGAAWAYDDSEFTKDDHRDWNVYRGYGPVRVHHGKPGDPAGGPITMTELRFYRGMDGDKLPSGTRSASVKDSAGGERQDDRWLQGMQFETQVHDGETESVVSKGITTPSVQGPTATRAGRKAYLTHVGTQVSYTALSSGGWRTTRTENGYDDRGMPTSTNDLGDTATSADDRCTTVKYKRNTDKWLISLPYESETVAVACTATPTFPRDAISDSRTFYDKQPLATPPTAGLVTRTEDLDQRPASGPITTLMSTSDHDRYGRVTSTADAKGRTTTTAYSPDPGPVTTTVVTDPAGFATTTTIDPAYGQPTAVVDPNNRKTEIAYDALGRKTEVWLANRTRGPNVRGNQYFTYAYHNDAPTVVTTTTIGPNGNYTSINDIYDGLLRLRQTQGPTKDGGRLITDTRYDSQGRNYKTTAPYFNSAPVDDKLWIASDVDIPQWTLTEFDGAGRKKAVTLKAGTADKWHGMVVYGGDRTTVLPDEGVTVTMGVVDARGQTVELRQYHGRTADGAYDSTTYGYTPAGQLASITDPAGQNWRHTYDLHGRLTVDQSPDKGTTTMAYDEAGQLTTRTDAKGTILAYDYDNLGRTTSEHSGSLTGPTLAQWTYDTAQFGKGLPATSTRYVNGAAYTTEIVGYDQLNKSIGTTVTIPATPTEPSFAATYTSRTSYKVDGSSRATTYAALPGLAAESVSYTYNDFGQALTATGTFDSAARNYVTDSKYTAYGELERTYLGDPGKQVWLSRFYDTNTRQLNRTIVDAEVPAPMQADTNYTYDRSGNITSIVDNAPGQADSQCFRYDYLQRLTEAWTPNNGCAADPSVPALSGAAPYWQSFSYDVIGNRKTLTQHASAGDTVQTSSYPAPGQPHAHRLDSVSTVGPGVNKTNQYTYDADGNTATRASQTLDWDAEGHLAKVTEGGKTTEFVYDANGNRLIRRDPTGSTLYLAGEELRLNSANGALTPTRYYSYGGQTVAMRDTAGLTWLAGDQQGTAQLAINATSLQVVRRSQTPFGGPRGAAVTFPGEKGFVGGTNDPSTGLVHLGAREYDPTLGRFLSVDPVLNPSDPQQLQGYTYSDNSPISKMDPAGQSFWSVFSKIVSVTATVLSFAVLATVVIGTGPAGWLLAAAAIATAADMFVAGVDGDNATVAIDLFSLVTGGAGGAIAKGGKAAYEGTRIGVQGWEQGERVAANLGGIGGAGASTGTFMHATHERRKEAAEEELAQQVYEHHDEAQDLATDIGGRAEHNRDTREAGAVSSYDEGARHHEQLSSAEMVARQALAPAVLALGPAYWPSNSFQSCTRVGTEWVGSYPCTAPGAVLQNPLSYAWCFSGGCASHPMGVTLPPGSRVSVNKYTPPPPHTGSGGTGSPRPAPVMGTDGYYRVPGTGVKFI